MQTATDGTTATIEAPQAPAAESPAAPAQPVTNTAAPDSDASYKAAFDALAEPRSGDSEAVDIDAIMKGVTGAKSEEKQDETPAKFGERPKPAAEKSDEPDEAQAREQREKVVLAKRALGRSGQWTAEEIEAMPDDRLIERGQKAHAAWEATERYKKDMEKWKAKARGQSPTASDPTDDSPGRSGGEVDSADADAAERLPEGFGQLAQKIEEWDPDLRKQIEKVAARDRQGIVKEAAAEVEKAQRALVQTRLSYATDKLADEFPALKDPYKLRTVKAKLTAWDPDGSAVLADDPQEFYALMRDACEVCFGRELRRQTQHARVTENARTRNGQPDVSTARQAPAALTQDQKYQVAQRLTAEYNGDQARVSAALAKLGISF